MAGGGEKIVINGHVWRVVTNETCAGRVYDIRDVIKAGGDERRINTQTS